MRLGREISILDFASAITEAIDLSAPALNNHHKRVAYIAWRIAERMGIHQDQIEDIVLAAMLHDICEFSVADKESLMQFDQNVKGLNEHAELGFRLLNRFHPLADAARLIRYHHTDYQPNQTHVPLGSHIIHLADRVDTLIKTDREILGQTDQIIKQLSEANYVFHPVVFLALKSLVGQTYFWFEVVSPSISSVIQRNVQFARKTIHTETFRDFARLLAQIIDFRSPFTATHSSGVASVAQKLAQLVGFSDYDCERIEIAGFLHDLGKLAVPSRILEKNGKLTVEEFNIVKKHAYYTHSILSSISGLGQIASWASYHHERLDGSGYPFHVSGDEFLLPAQIMATADIFTACLEDRPYRAGMNRDRTIAILTSLADNGTLNAEIVDKACENFSTINGVRIRAQQEASLEYQAFYHVPELSMRESLLSLAG
ncbi:MAG: HD domain-containing protein [Coriobacteriia bacterium]|nr:HD domain-containing protein [Coriobacteriia bacterium]